MRVSWSRRCVGEKQCWHGAGSAGDTKKRSGEASESDRHEISNFACGTRVQPKVSRAGKAPAERLQAGWLGWAGKNGGRGSRRLLLLLLLLQLGVKKRAAKT